MRPNRAEKICEQYGSAFLPPVGEAKVGIALGTLSKEPMNALRISQDGSACGWYIWGGEKMLDTPDFFQPLHVAHLPKYCAQLVPYLALAPGWRVLLAPNQIDVWFDAALCKSNSARNDT